MKSLGLRATSSKIFYSIYDSENKTIASEKITLPEVDFPLILKEVRAKFLEILAKNTIDCVGLKTAEKTAMGVSLERVGIEGVIQEAIATNQVKYSLFSLQSIAKSYNIKGKDFKPLTTDAEVFQKFIQGKVADTNFRSNNEQREAILIAIAAAK
jgi:hypothetical protein